MKSKLWLGFGLGVVGLVITGIPACLFRGIVSIVGTFALCADTLAGVIVLSCSTLHGVTRWGHTGLGTPYQETVQEPTNPIVVGWAIITGILPILAFIGNLIRFLIQAS